MGAGMAGAGNRWWGPRSDFPWEEDALKHVRGQMPSAEPYRAWQTFTFTARSGHVREVDLFIATPAGLFLVEIKSHPGRASNRGATWLFHGDDRVRTIENPLHLTNQKCKELKSQLSGQRQSWGCRSGCRTSGPLSSCPRPTCAASSTKCRPRWCSAATG